MRPIIGVTMDVVQGASGLRQQCALAYGAMIELAGGVPVYLPAVAGCVDEHIARVNGIVLTGGDDPRTEAYGAATHARATPVDPARQAYEDALLTCLAQANPQTPVLGVCLGMQMMALVAGGALDQYMPETCDPDGRHWDGEHAVSGDDVSGVVFSRHKQCVSDAGILSIGARADDGVIEMVLDPDRSFYLGVQWHPERTTDPALGPGIFERLVRAAKVSPRATVNP